MNDNTSMQTSTTNHEFRPSERGAALATALMVLALMAVISLSVLAVVSNEGSIAGSDLQRTQSFYAAQSGIEKMTSDFSNLFSRTSHPTSGDLTTIQNAYPTELISEGYSFSQSLVLNGSGGQVVIPDGLFAGLNAGVVPYRLTSTATLVGTGAKVGLQRDINNYLIPIFQFGMFSDQDIELHPGPPFYFNGRVHANGNIYVNGDTKFLAKVTTANEVVLSVVRNGSARTPSVKMQVGSSLVNLTMGSVVGGPNLPTSQQINGRGIFPGHPDGTKSTTWESVSVAAATGANNQFGGQLITRTTGGLPLLLPLQLGGNDPRELIKRRLPNEEVDAPIVSQSRFHSKAQIRILIDDENQTTADANGIPAGQGVSLSTWVPSALNGGKALYRVSDSGTYNATDVSNPPQQAKWTPSPTPTPSTSNQAAATTVRAAKTTPEYITSGSASSGVLIPGGSGVTGRIQIQIVPPNGGTPIDVTQTVLSMGITEGEPNGLVYLQRPLWAAYVQGARDRNSANHINLDYLTDSYDPNNAHNTSCIIDGEINEANFTRNATYGYFTVADNSFDDDAHLSTTPFTPTSGPLRNASPGTGVNRIVPINLYNVREGWINSALTNTDVYERGITSIVELNMRNIARWVVGTYDSNLLSGTTAVSTSIDGSDGYVVYVSDRRGDKVKSQSGVYATNGMVDNEDIYGPNGTLDAGEDVNYDSVLQNDTSELPSPTVFSSSSNINTRGDDVASWMNLDPADATNRRSRYFRRSVRIFNGETLSITGPVSALTTTKGITVSSENMVYIWGNYNTTGITSQPVGASTLNDGSYTGAQVPSAIVCDAFFPMSKTWFDSSSAMYPQGNRPADASLPGIGSETSVRCGIIAGNNRSALAADPSAGNGGANDERRLSGGLHNYPRFLENWSSLRWNFVGSLIPIFRSTQALGQYHADGPIYSPPIRNWAFDTTFTDPSRLPPGTPTFEFIQPTGFRLL